MINMQIFILIVLCPAAMGCSKKVPDDKVATWTEENPHGWYTFFNDITRECSYVRHETSSDNVVGTPQQSNCYNIPPGLAIMQHGYARDSFLPLQDKKRLREIVFFFSCEDNRTIVDNKYQKPTEVKYITSTPRTLGFKRIVKKEEMLKTFTRDIHLSEEKNSYIMALPLLRLDISESITSAAYLAEQVEGFAVALYPYTPSKQLKKSYIELPTPFEQHMLAYYRFVSAYGTDVITRTTFGGRFQALVLNERLKKKIDVSDENNITSVDLLVNECIQMEKNSFREVTILVEGGPASSRTNIKDWQREVMADPVSISPTLQPIYLFLEPLGMKEQKRGLERMTKMEEKNYNIKRLLYQLQILQQSHRLSTFLISLLQGEVNMVCPSHNVYETIKNGIINPKNIDFQKFHVTCTHTRYHSEADDKELIVSRKYKLIPGVCFSLAVLLTPCVKASMKLPVGVDCVYFYKERECVGISSFTAKTEDDIIKAFNSKHFSFVLCPSLKV